MSLFLENLSIGRGGAVLAANINLRLDAGGSVVLTGPNGSGKTTLLRTIAGLLKPLAGNIERPDALHWLGPDNALKGDLTVSENLDFWGGSATAALERLNIAGLADLPVRRLSAGQKRRAALARLLLEVRPLWLLDEPANGLDATASAQLVELVHDHTAAGGIAVIATHEPDAWQAGQALTLEAA